jgi:hypothetical protein
VVPGATSNGRAGGATTVTDGIESALKQAREAAGGKDVTHLKYRVVTSP